MDNSANNGSLILYQTEDGKTQIEVQLLDETVWLTQSQMAELFSKDKRTISEHIQNIFKEGELSADSTVRNFRIVQKDCNNRQSILLCTFIDQSIENKS